MNLEKLASFTAPEVLLLSALGGGSAFAGMRYLTDLSHKLNAPKVQEHKLQLQLRDPSDAPEKELNISSAGVQPTASSPGLSKVSQSNVSAEPDWWVKWLAGLAGAPIGFMGAKSVYDHYQESQADKQINAAKKNYTNQLMHAQQINKVAAETPIIDGFCEAAAEELTKDAGVGDIFSKILGVVKNHPVATTAAGLGAAGATGLASDTGKSALRHFPGLWDLSKPALGDSTGQIMDALPKDDPSIDQELSYRALGSAHELVNKGSGHLLAGGEDIWKGVSAAAGLGTLGFLIRNHLNKKEKEDKATYPSGIEYAKKGI